MYPISYSAELSQDSLSNYLLNLDLQDNMINSEEEANNMKKIFNAVIKKLIKDERMLMVVEDSNDLSKKMLQIHPNYV